MEQQPLCRVQAAGSVNPQELDRGGLGAGVSSTLPVPGTRLTWSWGTSLGSHTMALPELPVWRSQPPPAPGLGCWGWSAEDGGIGCWVRGAEDGEIGCWGRGPAPPAYPTQGLSSRQTAASAAPTQGRVGAGGEGTE